MMKRSIIINITSISVFALGLVATIVSYYKGSLFLLLIGIVCILIGVLAFILSKALKLFIMDRELNIEALKKAGLTIIKCDSCMKDNVLEDQYCVYCGERLGNENEIQEEYKT